MIKIVTACVGDLLHIGHVQMFERCRELGDYLIVGVVEDLLTAKYKRLPIIPQEQRLKMIKSLRCVDKAEITDTKSAVSLCRKYQPDIFVRADDWQDPEARDYMKSIGKRVIYLPRTDGVSTTDIITEIEKRYKLKQWIN